MYFLWVLAAGIIGIVFYAAMTRSIEYLWAQRLFGKQRPKKQEDKPVSLTIGNNLHNLSLQDSSITHANPIIVKSINADELVDWETMIDPDNPPKESPKRIALEMGITLGGLLLAGPLIMGFVSYFLLLLVGIMLFLMFLQLVLAATGWKRKSESNNVDPRLLVLRVFSGGKFTESIRETWPGSVSMLAGPDGHGAEPRLFQTFSIYFKSNLDSDSALDEYAEHGYFARNKSELERALASHEFYPGKTNVLLCGHDIWCEAVISMLNRTDFVFFDVTGINRSATGCLFELEILLNTFALERVLFVCDDQTETDNFKAIISEIWAKTLPQSPNLHDTPAEVTLLHMGPKTSRLYARHSNNPYLAELYMAVFQLVIRHAEPSIANKYAR
jgi:hypothetical protein